jgi:hypothetical protein
MSAFCNLLDDLARIGATIEPAGNRLILRAGPNAIPSTLVTRIRKAKADLLVVLAQKDRATFRVTEGRNHGHEINDRAFEAVVIEWLNKHRAAPVPGRCIWCGKPDSSSSAVVLPLRAEPGTHVWFHAECWSTWREEQRRDAVTAPMASGSSGGGSGLSHER